MRRWAMNCTIWRSTSMSAPFSASSASAIVEVVIVSSPDKVGGSHLNHIRVIHGDHPRRASRLTDLHHLLGHHRSCRWKLYRLSNSFGFFGTLAGNLQLIRSTHWLSVNACAQ